MKFKPLAKIKTIAKVKGLFSPAIPYEIRVPEGNWSPFFGHYQNQRWGEYDTSSCWALSMINCVEDQLEWFWKNDRFSKEAKDFFIQNKYIDADGDFSLSERFIEILGGQKINGGTAPLAWDLLKEYGAIPRETLTYTLEQSQKFRSENDFVADYFNPSAVTEEMKSLGKKFLQYVNVAYQQIGKLWTTPDRAILEKALKQAPLQIGIPVPSDVSLWNNPVVKYDGRRVPAHEIELYAINADGSYAIFDQYMPNLKNLSKDYYIPYCHQGVITPALTLEEKKTQIDLIAKIISLIKQLMKYVTD